MSRLSPTVSEERAQQRGDLEDARELLARVRDSVLPGSSFYLRVDQAVHEVDECLRGLR